MRLAYSRPPLRTDPIPRFAVSGHTENWSRQWKIWQSLHSNPQMREQTYADFRDKFGIDPKDPDIAPMIVLDAGCGNGRNSALFAGTRHEVHAIDLSASVDFAHTQIVANNIHFAQADLCDLPFADESFDFIFSDGVLIHVADVRQAIAALVKKLKPNGLLGLTLAKELPEENRWDIRHEQIIEFYRNIVASVSSPILIMGFVRFLSSLYHLRRVPWFGPRIALFIPEIHPDPEWRKCYIHDYLTARYRVRQKPETIETILKDHGMIDIHFRPSHEIRVTCRKPPHDRADANSTV